jgi:hypothetical protein
MPKTSKFQAIKNIPQRYYMKHAAIEDIITDKNKDNIKVLHELNKGSEYAEDNTLYQY